MKHPQSPVLGRGVPGTHDGLKSVVALPSQPEDRVVWGPEPRTYPAPAPPVTLIQEVQLMADNPQFIEPPTPAPKPTCKFYVSIDRTECGDPADHLVWTPNGDVELCDTHKAYHDRANASQRLRRQNKAV